MSPEQTHNASSDARVQETIVYVLTLHEGQEGYLQLAVGENPSMSSTGSYRSGLGQNTFWYKFPEEGNALVDHTAEASMKGDAFLTPYLMNSKERKKGNSVPAARRRVHADIDLPDGIALDLNAVRAIPGAFAIGSGTPGNGHVYVLLTEPVSLADHEILCRALGKKLGTKDPSKVSDNDLLRPPGTFNYKPTVMNGGGRPPRPVEWLIEPPETRISPQDLADLLGTTLTGDDQESSQEPPSSASDEVEEVPDFQKQYPTVYAAQQEKTGDRSEDTMRIAAACKANGFTLAQFRWVITGRPDLMERLEGRKDDDLARVWDRVTQHDDADDFETKVDEAVERMRIQEEARRRFDQAKAGPVQPFDSGFVGEILARPPVPAFRIEKLLPMNSSMLVVAQRKTGKTTLMLNLGRALVTEEPFLGEFYARTIAGNVAILNYEVSGDQLARWARDVGVPEDRVLLVNLRGVTNPLGQDEARLRLAAHLREHDVESLIVDPFSRAFTGKDQNHPGEVGRWLTDLDLFARSEVGASDLILTAHAGWGNDGRARGASALEDWPDSIVHMTLGKDGKQRFLGAIGRDVAIDEDLLAFDEDTRLLTMTGCGSRKNATDSEVLEELIVTVCKYIEDNPGASGTAIEKAMRARQETVRSAIKLAEDRGELRRVVGGPGRPTLHYRATPNSSTTSNDSDSSTNSASSSSSGESDGSGDQKVNQGGAGDE